MDRGSRDWHRLFGLMLIDFFTGTPFRVELEKDLSIKKQMLDVVILRREEGVFHGPLPDGLEPLARHNLITFKSYQEALDDWALKELTGHYVNYRKQVSPSMGDLLPEEDFRLYAVCARYPRQLAEQVLLTEVQPGVYDIPWGTDRIRVVVSGQLPQNENNAMLHLFSALQEQVQYGAEHYRQHSDETSTLLGRLLEQYRKEGVHMPYTMEDFRKDYVREHLKDLSPEEILQALPLKEILAAVSTEQLLEGLSTEQLLEGLSTEQHLAALPPEVREVLQKRKQDREPPTASQ